jgi:hypothetical protein
MDIRSVSRRFGAVALVVGPLALVAGSLFEVAGDDTSVPATLSKIARHQGEQRVLIAADLIAAFMLPAMVYLMRLSRRGAPRSAIVGGAVAFTGWLAGLVSLGGSDVLFYHAARLRCGARGLFRPGWLLWLASGRSCTCWSTISVASSTPRPMDWSLSA